jgi:hypothetical protein
MVGTAAARKRIVLEIFIGKMSVSVTRPTIVGSKEEK